MQYYPKTERTVFERANRRRWQFRFTCSRSIHSSILTEEMFSVNASLYIFLTLAEVAPRSKGADRQPAQVDPANRLPISAVHAVPC